MKKLVCILLVVAYAMTGCKTKKQDEYTVLGNYTPYQLFMEKLNGKVEKVIETNYWAVPDGESYKKGNKMTKKELDSLVYTGDLEATFDEAGDLVSCVVMDENKKPDWKNELIKENNKLARANFIYHDTLRHYDKLKCDDYGNITEVTEYDAKSDTLLLSWVAKRSAKGDSVLYEVSDYKEKPSLKILLLYNDLKQLLGYQQYNKDGNYTGGSEIKYNDLGKISGVTFYNKDKKPVTANTFINEYDSKGNWVKQICKDSKGFAIIGEREYKYFE